MLCLEALTIQVMSDECLIVGAGPTGLTLAIELKRLGVPTRLVDKAERATQWSQALVVQVMNPVTSERGSGGKPNGIPVGR